MLEAALGPEAEQKSLGSFPCPFADVIGPEIETYDDPLVKACWRQLFGGADAGPSGIVQVAAEGPGQATVGAEASKDAPGEKEPKRRALPAPFPSPPFPSAEYQGFPLIGVPRTPRAGR